MKRVTTGGAGFADPHLADRLRSLYVCYLGLDDPLVATQVLAYLDGLVDRGHVLHLLTFEVGRLRRARRRELRANLARRGIAWHGLRYHKRPSLPATMFDVICGAAYAALLIRRHRLQALHARSHVPAAMGLIARRLTRLRLIFDIRGLLAEEYEDAGRWARGSTPFRLTKWVQRLAIARAAGIVVLTERVRDHLFGEHPGERVHVIPCCADLERIDALRGEGERVRGQLGIDGPILLYVGKLTGWYMEREMAEFFLCARELLPRLHFLILTQSDPLPIETELARLRVTEDQRTITRCAPEELGSYLAAADAAVCFIRPTFSKISSSPTKIGEYLGAGLPLVCGAGIGDVDALLEEYGLGVVLDDFDPDSLSQGARLLARLVTDRDHAERSRRAARERLALADVGIPAYDALYRQVAAAGRARSAGPGPVALQQDAPPRWTAQ
jgi:glycosyltransferase involved in cell wall biosynthesis